MYFLKDKKKSKFRPFIYLLFFVVLVILICVILYAVFYSGLFRVENFDFKYSNKYIQGDKSSGFFTDDFLVSSLTAQVVGKKRLLGYFGPDNTLFWLFGEEEDMVNNNVLPSVEDVDVKVNVFKRKVEISINEKELAGVICKTEGSCYAFDERGRIFAPAPSVEGSLILKINDVNSRPLVLGEKFLPKEEWIENILKTIGIFDKNNFHIKSVTIREIDVEEWEIIVLTGPKFLFSLDFIPKDLNDIMRTLKERADFSSVNYFDMRVENRIYYK